MTEDRARVTFTDFTGSKHADVTLVLDLTANQVIERLKRANFLPDDLGAGQIHVLCVKRTRQQVAPDQSLLSAGVRDGDTIIASVMTRGGGGASLAHREPIDPETRVRITLTDLEGSKHADVTLGAGLTATEVIQRLVKADFLQPLPSADQVYILGGVDLVLEPDQTLASVGVRDGDTLIVTIGPADMGTEDLLIVQTKEFTALWEAWNAIAGKINTPDIRDLRRQVETLVYLLSIMLNMERFPQNANRGRLWCFWLDSKAVFRNIKLPEELAVVLLFRSRMRREDLYDLIELVRQRPGAAHIALLLLFGTESSPSGVRSLVESKARQILGHDIITIDRSRLEDVILSEEPHEAIRHLVLERVDLLSVSPYTTTGPTADNVFFGREPELRNIVENVTVASYAVVGGRRVGKTSLLGHLHRVRLPAVGFRTNYHDCSATPTDDLLQSLPTDKPLVLLLDEADKIVPADRASGWPLFSALRALTNSGHAQVVLSGERTLRSALRDPKSPLFNFANEMLLGPLDFYAVEELVTRPMKQLEIELVNEDAIVDRIWAFTSGHPNVVQRLCRRLIERLNEQDTRRITLDDVDAVIEDPGFQRDDFLSTYWEATTPLEKIISLLMADEESVRTLHAVRQALAERCNLRPKAREVDDALQRLVDLRSILKRTPTGYEFTVEAFPRVVAGTMTLADMLEILTEEYQEQGE